MGRHRLKRRPDRRGALSAGRTRPAGRFSAAQDALGHHASRAPPSPRRASARARAGRRAALGRRSTRHDHRPRRRREEPTGARGRGTRSDGAPRPPRRSGPDLGRRPRAERHRPRARRPRVGRATPRRRSGTGSTEPRRSSISTTSSTSRPQPFTSRRCSTALRISQILATSRMPLRLSTERVLPLGPLTLEDATTLFVELAAARGVVLQADALDSVHEICRRLDGLPLAIELVAARLVVLPPAEIVRALEEGLALKMEGPIDLPERQRTLRAAIDWSYQRLTDEQRDLHGALAVFGESATLADARAVARGGDSFLPDLEALVGWSLVRSEANDGEVRLSMLETVREYALDRLRADDLLDPRARTSRPALSRPGTRSRERSSPGRIRTLAGSSRARVRQPDDGARLAPRRPGERRTRSARVSALERFWRAHGARERGSSAGSRSASTSPRRLRTTFEPTRCGPQLARRRLRATGTLPCRCSRRRLSLFREETRQREEVFALSELGYIALRRNDAERAERLCAEALIARSRRSATTVRSPPCSASSRTSPGRAASTTKPCRTQKKRSSDAAPSATR